MESSETVKFSVETDREKEIKNTLQVVYQALTVKGYNPINQIIG